MGASESICHQHHTHSSQEDANDCNRRFEEALRRERQEAEKTFIIEAQKKFDDFVKQKMKTMEKKMDIIGSLVNANLDLTESDHQEVVKKLIFEDPSVAAAIVGVVRKDSVAVVGWGRNPRANGLQCLEF